MTDITGSLSRVASTVFNRPMMIEEYKLAEIARVLTSYRGVDMSAADLEILRMQHGVSSKSVRAEYEIVGDGLALIPVEGTLLHKTTGLDALSGLMSYKGIEGQLNAALEDNRVDQIAFLIKSSGGDGQGVFDLAEMIYEARGVKPISAIVDETAASAAYLIAAATSRIFVPQTAVVGSIGVVMRHENVSKMNERMGIEVEYIHAGNKKVLGNPDKPLSDADRAELNSVVQDMYGMFVDKVSQYTGLSSTTVRGTEAGMYMGSAAVQLGLATDQMSANDAIKTLLNSNKEIHRMTTKSGDVQATHTQDQVNLLVEEAKVEAHASGVAEGLKTGMETEQARVSAILEVEGASTNMAMVNKMVSDPKFSAKDMEDMIAAMPKATVTELTAAPVDQLSVEMNQLKNPDVGTDNGDVQVDDETAMVNSILQAGGMTLIPSA